MPPLLTINADLTTLERAFSSLSTVLQARVNEACQATAEAVVVEAKARLGRQIKGTSIATKARTDLGQNLTVEGIHAQPAYNGNGWVVLSDREPFGNVPLWLERGTRVGERHNFARTPPESYFYPSLTLQVGPHEQRLIEAMQAAANETGLGE